MANGQSKMEEMVNPMWQKLQSVYKGRKIFLTGHTGFKGSWLLKMFSMLGAEVKGYALAPQNEIDLYNLLRGDLLCDSIIADVRDKATLTEAITRFEPDFVFHLAAQPLVRRSYEIPAETFEVNSIGTANLLDGIRLLKNPCSAVLITTDKVYHNNEWEYPYRENDRLGGYDPYSASKACAELVIDSYKNSFFNIAKYKDHQKGIAVGRAGNVIGGGDWSKDRLVPDIVRALAVNDKIELRNPASVRPWQHVLEPLTGYLMLGASVAENPAAHSQAYNFGPHIDDALPVQDMTGIAIRHWGKGEYMINTTGEQLHEAGLLKLDISKVQTGLGWKPKWNADKAIENTITWYKQYFNDPDRIADFTAAQIMNFVNE